MGNKQDKNAEKQDSVVSVISSETFVKMEPEMQKQAIDAVNTRNQMEGGFMGKIFGTKKNLSEIFVAFALCVLLVIIGVIVNSQETWDGILTIFTATVGYIFGKGSRNDE